MDLNGVLAAETARILAAGGHIYDDRVNGQLALSRALGDFKYKKNQSLTPENQVITANPDVTTHDITEEDEFLVVACDGIWDCLSSQQVIDFVRLKVSEGKELSEIGEMICDHCLAPDISGEVCGDCGECDDCVRDDEDGGQGEEGIGCDNMTVLIVAILNGRTKEEWYAWVTDRVKQNYGYETPGSLPRIYAEKRLMAFKAQQEVAQGKRAGETK
jgi:protein phosphatase 2C family protein 2/3